MAVLWAIVGLNVVLTPPEWDGSTSDVLFVHVGGRGERIDRALALMDQHVAPVLVIPTSPSSEWPAAAEQCGRTVPFEVVCLDWNPRDTADEARVLAELTTDRNWQRATVLSSDYHLARATMLDRSCAPIEISPAPARSDLDALTWVAKVGKEIIGLPYSWLFERCRT